ncbi:MAG TPA: hypothetical protein VGL10_04100, partial [Gammaproteobacteria bacterium]
TLDGNEWSVQQVTEKSNPWLQDIAWNGEYFVLTTIDSDIYRSVDAKTWQHVVKLNGGIVVPRLRVYEGVFYLLGSTDSRLDPLPHSKDNGLTWQPEPAFMDKYEGWEVTDLIQVKDQYYYTLAQERMLWKLPDIALANWHMVESTSRDREHEKSLRRITGWLAYGNGRFVADERSRNGNRILISVDGRTWKEHALGFRLSDALRSAGGISAAYHQEAAS